MPEMKKININGFSFDIVDDEARALANAAIPSSEKGVANGVATLDGSGKIVSGQLPTMGALASKDKVGESDLDDGLKAKIDSANTYTDEKIGNLMNNSSEAVDSIMELAKAMEDNEDVVSALNEAIGSKARILFSSTKPEDLTDNDLWMKIVK